MKNRKEYPEKIVVGYIKADDSPRDELKRIGASYRRRNDISGLITVRGDFRDKLDIIVEISKHLWEKNKIFVTENIYIIGEHGLIIRIDNFMNEQKAVNIVNKLLKSKVAEIVYKPAAINYFDPKTIENSQTKINKQSKARRTPLSPPYSY